MTVNLGHFKECPFSCSEIISFIQNKGQIKEKGIENMLMDLMGTVLSVDLILVETELSNIQSMFMGSMRATKVGSMKNS